MDNSNIPAWSADGVIEAHAEIISRHLTHGNNSILELGAGTGKLSQILFDAGHKITAGDWNAEHFCAVGPECLKVDCDDANQMNNLFGKEQYDAVVCGDLIEHLTSPYQFVKSCADLLSSDGYLFITTPNILSPSSRVNIMVNGNPNGFGKQCLSMGHINPLFPIQLKYALENAGFGDVQIHGIGKKIFLREKTLRGFLQTTLALLIRPLMRNVFTEPCLLFIARKQKTIKNSPVGPRGIGNIDHYSVKTA